MTWKAIVGRLLLWSVPAVLTTAAIYWNTGLEHRRELAEARTALLDGDASAAAGRLVRIADSRWVREHARAPFLMALALSGTEPSGELSSPTAFREAGSRLLLHQAMIRGDFEGTWNLARMLDRAGDTDGGLFLAAVMIERAQSAEAAQLLHGLPAEVRSDWLGIRLEETLQLLSLDTLIIVEDRRGRQVGRITRDRRFEPARLEYRQILPVKAIEELCGRETSRSIRLTLDVDLSRRAARSLGPYRGSIVVMDPRNGQILAAVSDPRTLRREPDAALRQMREPASIAKLITSTAGLRDGIDVDEAIAHMRCRGAERYGGEFLYCAYTAGKLSGLDHAMAVSCNVAFANLGRDLGWGAMLDEYRRFGFDRNGTPGLTFGNMVKTGGTPRDLADLSIGLEVSDITPVHAAQLAAVFANRGLAPEPSLLMARDGVLRLSLQPAPVAPLTPTVDPVHADVVIRSMLAVTSPGGTASNLAPDSFPIAMKTGTGATPGLGYHTNYVGFGPVEQPMFAFAVRVTNIPTSKGVRHATADVTRRLMRVLAREEPPEETSNGAPGPLTRRTISPRLQDPAAGLSPRASRDTAPDAPGFFAPESGHTH